MDHARVTLAGSGAEYEYDRVEGGVDLVEVELADIDFSGADLRGLMLTGCRVRRCVVDRAKLDRVRLFGTRFEDCTFIRASLRDVGLGGKHRRRPNSFERVSFDQATITDTAPESTTFTDCDFGEARLTRVEFWGSRLTRCRFAGKLKDVIFGARRPILGLFGLEETLFDVNFEHATLELVDFRGLRLRKVTLPRSGGHLLIRTPNCAYDRVIAALKADSGAMLGDVDRERCLYFIEAQRRDLAPSQVQALLDLRPLEVSEDGQRQAAALFRWAERACAEAAGMSGR